MTTPTPTPDQTHAHVLSCHWDLTQARWSCAGLLDPSAFPVSSTPSTRSADLLEQPLVDVRDMLVVHTAMMREFRLAPAAVLRVGPGDRRQAAVVSAHLRFINDLLHHHHHGEDVLLWPKLRARTSTQAVAVIDEVEEQHTDLDLELGAVERLRATWANDPTSVARDQLVHHLDHLYALLRDHLELEERALLPLAAAVLTKAEWDEIGQAGVTAISKHALPLVFGMFAYEGDPAVLADMLHAAPPIARVVLPPLAKRAYAQRARRVHGTARP